MWRWTSSTNSLYHHGIKGQKWGVRRYQNKDGSLTSAGKKRYNDDNETRKTTHKDKLVSKYMKEGLNEQNAKTLAERRIKAEKIIAGVALVTATALVGYAVNDYVKNKADILIKQGDELQRIIPEGKRNTDKALYVSFKKDDNLKYEGIFGYTKGAGGYFNVEKMTLQAKQPIKIASRRRVENTFVDLFKNDPEFKKNMVSSIKEYQKHGWIPHQIDTQVKNLIMEIDKGSEATTNNPFGINEKSIRTVLYDAFNASINNHSEAGKKASRSFYDKLLSAGYDAISDINDQKYSGYNATQPTIIFNTAKLAIAKVEALSSQQINNSRDKAYALKTKKGKNIVDRLLSDLGQYTVFAGIAATAASVPAIQVAAIKKYRKEHPNSELSDQEILAMLT